MKSDSPKLGAIIQARMGSTRLPGKTMRTIAGKPVLQHVVERVGLSKLPKTICVATSTKSEDDVIAEFCETRSIGLFRGSENDVLQRFYLAARRFGLYTVVRITADSPLVGPEVIDFVGATHLHKGNDLTTGYQSRTFPAGTVVSVLNTDVLEYLINQTESPRVREHIVIDLGLIAAQFQVEVVRAPQPWQRSDLRYEVDYEEDFELVSTVIEHFSSRGIQPSTTQIIGFLDRHPELRKLNQLHTSRGY